MSKIGNRLEEAIRAYENCVPMVEIAGWFGMTRQGLWKAFKAAGVETRKGRAAYRVVVCDSSYGLT